MLIKKTTTVTEEFIEQEPGEVDETVEDLADDEGDDGCPKGKDDEPEEPPAEGRKGAKAPRSRR